MGGKNSGRKSDIKKVVYRASTIRATDRIIITPAIILGMMEDYHKHNMTINRIAEKYGCTRQTVNRQLKKNTYDPQKFIDFNPRDVMERVNLPLSERMLKSQEDATQTLEMTFAALRYKLDRELQLYQSNENKTGGITIRELKDVIDIVAPYVLQSKKKSEPDSGKKDASGSVRSLFKAELNKKAQ